MLLIRFLNMALSRANGFILAIAPDRCLGVAAWSAAACSQWMFWKLGLLGMDGTDGPMTMTTTTADDGLQELISS